MILNWGGEKKNDAEEQKYYRKGRYHEKANLQFVAGANDDAEFSAKYGMGCNQFGIYSVSKSSV